MIKARAGSKDEPIVLFGLSEMNIKKLKAGQPMLIDMTELGMKGKVYIMYGKTEEDIAQELKPLMPQEH